MGEEEKKLPSDKPPWLQMDVKGKGGRNVPVVATVPLEGGKTVYQRGAGNPLTLVQTADVQRVTQEVVDPALQHRVEHAKKIADWYGKRAKSKKESGIKR